MARLHVIKSQKQIDEIQFFLNKHKREQYSKLWTYGVNIGLTVVEILATTMKSAVKSLATSEYIINRNGQEISLPVNDNAKYIIREIHKRHPIDTWLFQSHWRNSEHKKQPLSRVIVHQVFNDISELLDFRLGDHSMRKARGAMLYKEGYCIESISEMLGHSAIYETYRYLEITPRKKPALGITG